MFAWLDDAAQDSSAFRERKLCKAPPLVDQDVEGVVENARFRGAKVLEEIEIRPAIWTKRYQLSVDHRTVRKIFQCRRYVMKLLVKDILPAGVEGCFAGTPHHLKPVSVQLDFIGPSGALWEFGDRKAIHRLDEADARPAERFCLAWKASLALPHICGLFAYYSPYTGRHVALRPAEPPSLHVVLLEVRMAGPVP